MALQKSAPLCSADAGVSRPAIEQALAKTLEDTEVFQFGAEETRFPDTSSKGSNGGHSVGELGSGQTARFCPAAGNNFVSGTFGLLNARATTHSLQDFGLNYGITN